MISVDEPSALAAGKAFADLSSWRATGVSGSDAIGWLNGLVSAEIDGLGPGRARRSLLLSPLGAVVAEFCVAVVGGSVVLFQDPAQPRPIGDELARFVLSSDVHLDARDGAFAVFAFPGCAEAPDSPGSAGSVPSCLGVGSDMISLAEDHERVSLSLAKRFLPATPEELEAWRVSEGIPRVGVDSGPGDLPHECGLEEAVSFDKGCFLGQEAVAKARNRGHPRHLLLGLESEGSLAVGDEVLADGEPAGRVTSAAAVDGRSVALARVRWERRDGTFTSSLGVALHRRPLG